MLVSIGMRHQTHNSLFSVLIFLNLCIRIQKVKQKNVSNYVFIDVFKYFICILYLNTFRKRILYLNTVYLVFK